MTGRASVGGRAGRLVDVRTVRRSQQKQAGLLPTFRFRSKRVPNKRHHAERDACRTSACDGELE